MWTFKKIKRLSSKEYNKYRDSIRVFYRRNRKWKTKKNKEKEQKRLKDYYRKNKDKIKRKRRKRYKNFLKNKK